MSRYRVTLTEAEREMLEKLSTTGVKAAKTILYARAMALSTRGHKYDDV